MYPAKMASLVPPDSRAPQGKPGHRDVKVPLERQVRRERMVLRDRLDSRVPLDPSHMCTLSTTDTTMVEGTWGLPLTHTRGPIRTAAAVAAMTGVLLGGKAGIKLRNKRRVVTRRTSIRGVCVILCVRVLWLWV